MLAFITNLFSSKKSVASNEVKITYMIQRHNNSPVTRTIKLTCNADLRLSTNYLWLASSAIETEREGIQRIYPDYRQAQVLFIDSPIGRIAPSKKK